MYNVIDLTDKVFGNWTVLNRSEKDYKYTSSMWLCRCACGVEGVVAKNRLINSKSTQCKKCSNKANASVRIKFDSVSKYCPGCKKMLPLDNFHKAKKECSGLNVRCKECVRIYRVFINFKLTHNQHLELLAKQNYKCAINGCNHTVTLQSAIDHDHECCPARKNKRTLSCGKCVRGILCATCNLGLGGFYDSIDKLNGAIQYLLTSRETK